jgi:hypothetical protein
MKLKSLVILTALLLTANAYAMEIHNGHLVSHKEWTTGGAKMMVTAQKSQHKAAMLSSKKLTTGALYANVFNSLDIAKGTVGNPIDIKSIHGIYLSNQTEQTHQYFYIFGVCAQVEDHRELCGYYNDVVELQPGGYVGVDEQPYLQVAVNKPGEYQLSSFSYAGKQDEYNNTTLQSSSDSLLLVTAK